MTDPGHLTDEETPDTVGAYPRLSEHQLTALGAVGEARPTTAGGRPASLATAMP